MVPKWKQKKHNANIKSQRPSTELPINLMRQSQRVEKISGGRGLKGRGKKKENMDTYFVAAAVGGQAGHHPNE